MYMKPDLRDIFQDRFSGHEAPVDPGTWQGIQSKLDALSSADGLQEMFQEKFNGHELDVDPSLWNSISSQIGSGAAVGTTAGGGIIGWAAAGVTAVVVATAIFFVATPEKNELTVTTVQEEVVSPAPIQPASEEEPLVSIGKEEELVQENSQSVPAKATSTTKKITPNPVEKSTTKYTEDPKPTGGSFAQLNGLQDKTTVQTKGPEADPQGKEVVANLIQEIEESVKRDALISGQKDPAGPPPPTVTPDIPPSETDPPTPKELPDIYLPNTFTPNGDGINDTYTVDITGFERMFIRVYSLKNDREVFSTDTNEPWDGANCEKGYYLVAIEALTEDGQLVTKGKAVWLNNDR
jgi:hypothetical protein